MATHFETDAQAAVRRQSFDESKVIGEALRLGTNEASRVTIERVIDFIYQGALSGELQLSFAAAQGFKYGYEGVRQPIVSTNKAGVQ